MSAMELVTGIVLASSSSGDGGGELFFLLAGPISGTALYWAIFRYYRNTDKTHRFETETSVERKGEITGDDRKVDEVRGTRERSIRGANHRTHRKRVARITR